jgi:hypothetical protein
MTQFLAAFAIYASICGWIWAILDRLQKSSREEDFLKEVHVRIERFQFDGLYYVFVKTIDAALGVT